MDAGHVPQYPYTREDLRVIARTPAPHWTVQARHNAPVPQKVVHVEGELTVKACRALMKGLRHQLSKHEQVELTHEHMGRYIKTTIR